MLRLWYLPCTLVTCRTADFRGFSKLYSWVFPSMASPQGVVDSSVLQKQPGLELLKPKATETSLAPLRVAFWSIGILLASVQAWIFRYAVSADSISYFDMSDGVLRGGDWHRLINGMYSALYPFLLGLFRRGFHISPANEIAAGHWFGVVLFVFAFACFEFFLSAAVRELETRSTGWGGGILSASLPKWAFLSVAYCVFLWSAIEHISLIMPRADMLLSGFIYVSAGLLLRMKDQPARWKSYLVLGAVLGIGILAKEAMLPIGLLMLLATFFLVENWRPALKMAPAAAALMFCIGCLYFVPLSIERGHFTLGEAGRSVYTVNVDQATPHWYLQSIGSAKGSFLHPPQKIFSNPPAYAFPFQPTVTEPLRYDQSYWLAGVRPRLDLHRELAAIKLSAKTFTRLFRELGVVIAAIFVLLFLSGTREQMRASLLRAWPVWLIGAVGCLMYAVIVVEPRYVTAFLTLCCVGLLVGLPLPAQLSRKTAQLIAFAAFVFLLLPVAHYVYTSYAPSRNEAAEAAKALQQLGVKAGDPVARISPSNADLTVERILRTEITAEVDKDHSAEFWKAPVATQEALLQAFASRGVKAVIATSPVLNAQNQSEWIHLGTTQYWAWRPASQ
jgi:uncharacterized membrane protein